MSGNNVIKYIFSIVVIILILGTMYFIVKNRSKNEEYSLDQTSTVSNIQTDLRLAIAGYDTINPILSNNRNVHEISKVIYEPLITLDENYKMEYCLAEEVGKTDDVTYVIKLRKGVLWQDKSNFTADDVKFTMDIIRSGISTIYTDNLRYVADYEVIDSTTIKIYLSEPVPFFEYNLTFPILCKSYHEGEDFGAKAPIGTGPFKISDLSSNVIKLVKNDIYWNSQKEFMPTEININLYATIGEVYAAFKNGEIDILTVKIPDVEKYIGSLGYNKIEYKSREYDFISLNTTSEVLSDKAVRKAISLIIDKNNIVASCLGSGYVSSNFSLDMGCWLYTKDLNIGVDTEQANQLLASSGWERSNNSWVRERKRLELSLTVNTNNELRIKVAENIKEQLENFGIPVTIRYLSAESYADAINNRDYEMVLTGIRLGYSPNLSTFFGNGNIANYYNTEVEEIMNMVSNTNDENTLYERYNRLYDIYLDEAPYIGLYRDTNVIVYHQGLVGNIRANEFNIYHNIEKWYRQ